MKKLYKKVAARRRHLTVLNGPLKPGHYHAFFSAKAAKSIGVLVYPTRRGTLRPVTAINVDPNYTDNWGDTVYVGIIIGKPPAGCRHIQRIECGQLVCKKYARDHGEFTVNIPTPLHEGLVSLGASAKSLIGIPNIGGSNL